MLCLSGFELYSRWVPLNFVYTTLHLTFYLGLWTEIAMLFWLNCSTSFCFSSTLSFKDFITELIFFLRTSVASCKGILT